MSHSISITGFVVLGGNVKSIPDPKANFRNAFEGTTDSAWGLTNALIRINFAYEGYANAFNMVNEVKVRRLPLFYCYSVYLTQIQNPIKTIRWAGPASLLLIAVLYMFVNIAYFAASKLPIPS